MLGLKRAASNKPKKPEQEKLLRGFGRKRSLQEWKSRRKRTVAEVKDHLNAEQPLLAIKKLTRALLEDPQHPPYFTLLKKAVAQRRKRQLKTKRRDPWAQLPKDLHEEALQLEAFSVYVGELEQLFNRAGIPRLNAPPPPGARQAKADQRSIASQERAANSTASSSGQSVSPKRRKRRRAPDK